MTTETDPVSPFQVGDQLIRGTTKKFQAVVTKVEPIPGNCWFVTINRRSEKVSVNDVYNWYRAWFAVRPDGSGSDGWRLATGSDVSFDQTAQLLARAVFNGDTTAALALADRMIELCGSVPR